MNIKTKLLCFIISAHLLFSLGSAWAGIRELPPSEIKRRVDIHISRASEAFNKEDYNRAIREWTEVLQLEPGNQMAMESIRVAQEKIKQQGQVDVTEENNPERSATESSPPIEEKIDAKKYVQEVKGEKVRFFGTLDYSVTSEVNNEYEDNTEDVAYLGGDLGYRNIQANTKTTEGVGVRFGIMFPVQGTRGFELGSSFGYYIGPKVEQTISAPNNILLGVGPASASNTVETRYLRLMVEGSQKFSIKDRLSFKMGAGLGIASGRAEQTTTYAGSLVTVFGVPPSIEKTENWTGFTWEVGPSIVMEFDQAAFELGVRYASFPTLKENDDFLKTKWNPFMIYAGISF